MLSVGVLVDGSALHPALAVGQRALVEEEVGALKEFEGHWVELGSDLLPSLCVILLCELPTPLCYLTITGALPPVAAMATHALKKREEGVQ